MNERKAIVASPIHDAIWKQKISSQMEWKSAYVSVITKTKLAIEDVSERLEKCTSTNAALRYQYEVGAGDILLARAVENPHLGVSQVDWSGLDIDAQHRNKQQALAAAQCKKWSSAGLELTVAKLHENYTWLLLEAPAINVDNQTLLLLMDAILGDNSFNTSIDYADVAAWLNEFQTRHDLRSARSSWSNEAIRAAVHQELGLRNYKAAKENLIVSCPIGVEELDVTYIAQLFSAHKADVAAEDFFCAALRKTLHQFSDGAVLARNMSSRSGELSNVAGPLTRAVTYDVDCQYSLIETVQNELNCKADLGQLIECFSKQNHLEKSIKFLFESVQLNRKSDLYKFDFINCPHEDYKICFTLVQQDACWKLHIKFDTSYISFEAISHFIQSWQADVLSAFSDSSTHSDVYIDKTAVLIGDIKVLPYNVVQRLKTSLKNSTANVVGYSHGQQEILSFQELNNESNKVANALLDAGIGAGNIVALHTPRGINFVIGMLGIIKAGATYLPLDLSNPKSRNKCILDICNPAAMLYQDLEPDFQGLVIDINSVRRQHNDSAPEREFVDNNAAYVLFTSGSTGQPKGVQIGMAALMNHMDWMLNTFDFTAEDKFLHRTSTGFDASVWELWAPLLLGADLIITPEEAKNDQNILRRILQENSVTVIQTIPSLAEFYLDSQTFDEVSSIKYFFLGGEALKTSIAKRLVANLECDVVNLYGPTECCIQVASYRYESSLATQYVPIGSPINNTKFLIVDSVGNKVSHGQVGELLVTGNCLFLGYYGKPELTRQATKIIENETYYCTGDLVQVLYDGTLYYLERKDDQIKYNGNRLELQEIANFLIETKSVAAAHSIFDKRLGQIHLFIIDPQLDIFVIKQQLINSFPEYMLPSEIHLLIEFPRLGSGKINNGELIKILDNHLSAAQYSQPEADEEHGLFNIWRELIGNTNFGIDTDFYSAGGDSLLAMKLANRISVVFNMDVKMGDLFKHKTIRTFAQHVQSRQRGSTLVKLDDFKNNRGVLSYTQKRMWFVNEFEGLNAVYNVPATFKLVGNLDVDLIASSINKIIARHQVLRTNIISEKGEPKALVHDTRCLDISYQDISGLLPKEKQEEIILLQQQEASFHFDLANDLLLRLALVRISDNEHVMIITMHHVVSDGWSSDIFIRELTVIYNASKDEIDSNLPVLDTQYADFAAWQLNRMESETYKSQLDFWKQYLESAPILHSLPLDKPRALTQSFSGKTLTVSIPELLGVRVDSFCKNNKVTLFTLLQGLLAVLVSRYSDVDDVVMGSPSAGRNDASLENLIGCFVNTIVLRNRIDPQQSFGSFLKSAEENIQLTQENQDVPFDVVVEALDNVERSLSANPIFQIMIVQENGFSNSLNLNGVVSSWIETENNYTKFDLILGIYRADDGFSLSWTYNSDLFNAATITQFADSYQALLEAALHNPHSSIYDLPLSNTQALEEQNRKWNNTLSSVDIDRRLESLIAVQVTAAGERVAVSDGHQRLTYFQLDELTNRLANRLKDAGIASGDVIGVCMDRSIFSVAALVAILKAGAIYMPLDVSRTTEYLERLISESHTKLLFSDSDHEFQIPVIRTSDFASLNEWQSDYQTMETDASAPACLMYTSGSSGQPKGVLLSHRGLVNRLLWMASVFPCAADEVVAQKTSLSFVDHLAEILQPLSEGACCEVINDEELKDLDSLIARLEAANVTRLTLVPSLLRALLAHPRMEKASAKLRYLISSGEALTEELAANAASRISQARIINLYGSTEVSADAVWMEYQSGFCQSESIAIGQPIANMCAFILNEKGHIQPAGVVGELCLGGPGLALAYLHEVEGHSRFCNYAHVENGVRLYRTGDKCYRDKAGNIHYLGRKDSQLKIRGMRVEAAEIENALYQLPDVKEVVVGCVNDHLVAWLVTGMTVVEKRSDWIKARRKSLKSCLPDYMIPDTWLILDSLPRTQTGKLNRKSLPAPMPGDYAQSTYIAPRNERELQVCQLWQEILNIPKVGLEDNFFLLGGHSLLATRLLSRLREQFHIQLSLKVLFANPTVAELMLHLDKGNNGYVLPAMQPVVPAGKYELSYAQERLWFLNQLGGDGSEYNLPMQFRVIGKLDIQAMQKTLDAIVARHEILRTVIDEKDGRRCQIIRPAQSVNLCHHDLQALPEHDQLLAVGRITRNDARIAFDLRNDLLVRAHAFTLANDENVIFINIHHIAADGWSLGIFYREFNSFYDAYCQLQAPQLPDLVYQYKDFAHWQRNWLKGEALEKEIEYWRSALADLPMVHSLPLDKARPPRLRHQGKVIGQCLDSKTLAAINKYCQEKGITLFMFLHSVFSVLFSRYSREQDIVMGTPMAGRSQTDMDPMIGHFVNTLVLRAHVDSAMSFDELVLANREQLFAAFEHQHVPFEVLVDKLNPVRSLSHSPLFQIMLTLQNNKQHDIALKGLEKRGGIETLSAAKFDLEMITEEYNDQLFIDWVYNLDLFEAETIERMARSFDTLVGAILSGDYESIALLPIINDRERMLTLENWSETDVTYSDVNRLENFFRKSVKRMPEKVAIVDQNVRYTYQEIDIYSNELCQKLIDAGVEKNDRVGVYISRSVESVIAILAVLKAGAVYVVMDPEYPRLRHQFIINDSSIRLIIGLPLSGENYFAGVTTIDVNNVMENTDFTDTDYSFSHLEDINAAACVIYTSGSTGEPKGVVLSHAGFANRICWMRNMFPASEAEIYCQKTSLNFVDHVAEIFQPLSEGITSVIVSEQDLKNVVPLLEQLRDHKVSRITLVPSLLKVLLGYESFRNLTELKLIISSGEALADQLAESIRDQLPQVRLLNLYGSTEVSADVTYHLTSSHSCDEVMQYFIPEDEFIYRSEENETYKIPLKFDECYTTPATSYEAVRDHFTNFKMPDTPAKIGEYIERLNRDVIPFAVNVSAPQYIGHMTSLLPNFMVEFSRLITVLNQNLVKMETSKSLTFLERQAIAMVHREFFNLSGDVYEQQTQAAEAIFGLVVSGGTSANITAMLSARNKGLFKLGYSSKDLREKGASKLIHEAGMKDAVIICSKLAHYSIKKAANILGIGEQNIIALEQDENQRVSLTDLKKKLEYCDKNKLFVIAVIGIAGATETGTIDPLPAMAKIAARYNVHFHVDAAWGGTLRFAGIYKRMLKGIEQADSVTFCAHKQLYLPQGISICLFKDPLDNGLLSTHARYQAQAGSYDNGQYTIEGSRPATALFLHAALHLLSRQGYSWLLERGMENTNFFKRLIENSGAFELIGKPDMNILNYRYIPDALRGKKYKKFSIQENEIINEAVDKLQWIQFLDGKTFVSKTSLNVKSVSDESIRVFRVVLSNPLVSKQDLKAVLINQLEIAAREIEQPGYDIGNQIDRIKNFSAQTETETVPIGKPISNMKVFLLDDARQQVPVGVKGDLYISGPGLALGYQNHEALNAERFVTAQWDEKKYVMFKTGDVARWLENGELQYVGRSDNCVKIRGAMVDLVEIEMLISQLDGVKEVALVATKVIGEDLQIAAYVVDEVLSNDQEIASMIRTQLRAKVPAYMIPEYFISMETLPKTASGKINRKLLPVITADQSIRSEYVAPGNELEREISEIWKSVLKVSKIGVRDCFFEIGGHSLLAMTMLNRLKENFGIKILLRDIFEYSTVEDLASLISTFNLGSDSVVNERNNHQLNDDIELII